MDAQGLLDVTLGRTIVSPVGRPSLKPYAQHLASYADDWRRYLKMTETPLSFSAAPILNMTENNPSVLYGRHEVVKFVTGEQDGRIWHTQTRTTAEVLDTVLQNPGRSGVIVGATMCGKTGTANNCHWLAPMLYLLTGQKYQVITLLPNKVGIERQAKDEWEKFLTMYGDCKVSNGEDGVSLNEYFTTVIGQLDNGRMFEVYDPGVSEHRGSSSAHIRRSPGQCVSRIKEICKRAHRSDCRVIFFIDEIHYGTSSEGVQWQILNAASEDLLKEGHGDFIIGLSATPWQVINLSKFWNVGHRLDPKYVGFNIFNGKPIDPETKCEMPNYMSFSAFESLSAIPGFTNVHRPSYYSSDTFEKTKAKQRKTSGGKKLAGPDGRWFPESHAYYKRQSEKAIAQALNWALMEKNPCQGLGAVVRFPAKNQEVTQFVEALRKQGLDELIEVIDYTGKAVSTKIARLIRDRKGADDGRPYVIIATGSLRMADNIPASCNAKYYFDFSEQSDLTALFQGLLGRATGNGKGDPVPMVILSQSAKETVSNFVRTQGKPPRAPRQTVATGESRKGGRPSQSITLFRHLVEASGDPDLIKMWDTLDAAVGSILDPHRSGTSPRPKSGRDNFIGTFWSSIFSPKRLDKIEGLRAFEERFDDDFHILRPGELDETGRGWHKAGVPGMARVGFRRANGRATKNSNLEGDRYVEGGDQRSPEKFKMVPQIHVARDRVGQPWKLVAVRLRLQHARKTISLADNILPDLPCGYSKFHDEQEREAVETSNAKRLRA